MGASTQAFELCSYAGAEFAYDEKRDLVFILSVTNQTITVVALHSSTNDHAGLDAKWAIPPDIARFYMANVDEPCFRSVVYDNMYDRLILASVDFLSSWTYSNGKFELLCCVEYDEPITSYAKLAIDYDNRLLLMSEVADIPVFVLSLESFEYVTDFAAEQISRSGDKRFQYSTSEVAVNGSRLVLLGKNGQAICMLLTNGYKIQHCIARRICGGTVTIFNSLCVDNQERIIVGSKHSRVLEARNSCGVPLFEITIAGSDPAALVFDRLRDRTICLTETSIFVINSNEWLENDFNWSVARHRHAPKSIKDIVFVVTVLRSLLCDSKFSELPNELLFEIFSHL